MGRKLAAALIEAGISAITHDSFFEAQDTPDELWLERAGIEGWIVLTKDKLIRKRPIERLALHAAGVRAFVFTGGNLSGVEMAESIIAARVRAGVRASFFARGARLSAARGSVLGNCDRPMLELSVG
jgi:hypothetical protein